MVAVSSMMPAVLVTQSSLRNMFPVLLGYPCSTGICVSWRPREMPLLARVLHTGAPVLVEVGVIVGGCSCKAAHGRVPQEVKSSPIFHLLPLPQLE